MSETCCPLCKGETSKLMVMFVNFVTSNEENVKAYFDKTLTFESWKANLEQAIGEEKNVQ